MQRYCKRCEEERTFNLTGESTWEYVYECDYCSLTYKQATALGYGAKFAMPLVAVLAGIAGVEASNDHDSNQGS